jgi:hypothetical protein
MSLSRRRPTPPVLSPAEAEVAEWILSGDELPDDLDSHLQTVVMAKEREFFNLSRYHSMLTCSPEFRVLLCNIIPLK